MTTVDRLRVIYEMDDAKFRQGSERMRRNTRRNHDDIMASASRMERTVGRSFKGMSASALAAATSILSLGAAFAALNKYTNNYVTIENRLRSIGEFSDEAGEKLLAAAVRSRAAVEDMSTATARIAKATGADFDTTVRRVETLNKLLAIGGATTAERGSVMLQLSQALSSGVLQGDELRSLREAAPVEVLDAIAAAAGTTRGELKKLGEEGKLTSDIVIEALDNLAVTADTKLKNAVLTTADAFTNLNSAATVFFGRLDEGLGTQQAVTEALQGLAEWLSTNADEAEEFGRSFMAGVDTAMGYVDDLRGSLEALGIISEDAFRSDGASAFMDDIQQVIDFIVELNAHIEASAEVAKQAFLGLSDAIASGFAAAINIVGNTVQHVVNTVLNGVRRIAGAIDSITGAAANLNNKAPEWAQNMFGLRKEGTNLKGMVPGNVKFNELETNDTPNGSGEALGDVYDNTYAAAKAVNEAAVADATANIRSKYNLNKGKRDIANNADLVYGDLPPNASSTVMSDPQSPGGVAGGGGGKKKGGGKGKGKEKEPFWKASEEDLRSLEREIELVGKSTYEQARMRAEWELMDKAKEEGLPINDKLKEQISAQAEEFARLTVQLEQGQANFKRFEQGVEGIAEAMSGALLKGESLREGLANVLHGIASDILQSGIKNALLGQFDFGGGGGGGFARGLLNAFMGGGDKLSGALRLAGARATGGTVRAGQLYEVGERGRELFKPNVNGTIIPNHELNKQGQGVGEMNINIHGARGNAEIMDMVREGVAQGMRQSDKALPYRIKELNRNDRKR